MLETKEKKCCYHPENEECLCECHKPLPILTWDAVNMGRMNYTEFKLSPEVHRLSLDAYWIDYAELRRQVLFDICRTFSIPADALDECKPSNRDNAR